MRPLFQAFVFFIATCLKCTFAQGSPRSCNDDYIWIANEVELQALDQLNCTVLNGTGNLGVWTTFPGVFSLPVITTAREIDVPVDFDDPCNLTEFSMPDLINTTFISFQNIPLLTNLSLPKLREIGAPSPPGYDLGGDFEFNYTGVNPVAVSLPALENVWGSLRLWGNVDGLDLPSIQNASYISINVTGNLDCIGFLTQVSRITNATNPMFAFACSSLKNHAEYNEGEHRSGDGPCDIIDNATCIWSDWTASASSTGNNSNHSSNKSGVASLYDVGSSSTTFILISAIFLSTMILLFL